MAIEIIAEGSTKMDYLRKRWGLSILIDREVLFDTFCNARLLRSNFEKYNIDLKNINHIIISHEHWDHSGGLWWILENNKNIKVYICSNFSNDFKKRVKEYGCSMIEVTKSISIKDNIFSSGEIKGSFRNQTIYEQSLIIKKKNTIAVITGCSHPGIIKILTSIRLEHRDNIDMLLGGLHLTDKSNAEIRKITKMFDSTYKIKNIAPFHCTGNKAIKYFEKHIPQRLLKITCGDCLSFNTKRSSWELVGKGR